jgi:hypothetical protein
MTENRLLGKQKSSLYKECRHLFLYIHEKNKFYSVVKVHIMELKYIKEFQSNILIFQTYEPGNTYA